MKHNFCPYCMTPVEEGKPCGACGLTQGSYTPSPHHLPPGTVLKERYLVGRVLGEGGFGITYIGCDLQLELKVAIKEYFPTDKASRMSQASLDVASYTGAAGVNYDKGLEKFLQEARTIARMDKQPVIVNVRDFFQVNHTAYIVMEYVEGTTFKDLTEQRGGRIPAGELLYLMEPMFFALKEMHVNGLIHRDISPENLMLEKGEVRLLDFGCARESAGGDNTLTIALKHGYAPVEQYQSKGQGPWTDVYALSATIYYCLTGRKPPQAMDRLVEDELIPPRKLGVDLTQKQENALLHGMAVPPKRRFQSMEEFHTALYEGFVPDVEEENEKVEPDVTADKANTDSMDAAEKTVESPDNAEKAPAHLPGWLKQNKLLAGGIAAALALAILLGLVLPRLLGPSGAAGPDPTQTAEPPAEPDTPPEPEKDPEPAPTPAADPEVDYLAQVMETVEWLRQEDVEVDEAELRARLDELPIDELFADAVHVTTLAELDAALRNGEQGKPIVIDGDIDFSGDRAENRNNQVPVLISEGVTVTASWDPYCYEDVGQGDSWWTVDGSVLVNRGTLRGRSILGDWDNNGTADTTVLLNYGTIYSELGAGYNNDSLNVVVNLGTLGQTASQFRQTSFYNLGTLLHGTMAPEGETPVALKQEGGDYFMDCIDCYFYNSGEVVLKGKSNEVPGRLDVALLASFVNRGSIRLDAYGELRNHATLLNYGEITAADSTGVVNNDGWLCNAGPDCVLDARCVWSTGIVQAGRDTAVDLSAVQDGGGGAVLPFDWGDRMDEQEGWRIVSGEEEFYQALEDRDCAWVVLGSGASLTLTEDLIFTKGLAIPYDASLTVDGCSLTVAGEEAYLVSDSPVDLRGGVLTVRDEAVGSVIALTDCGGVTLKNQGYLLVRTGLGPNDGAAIELSDARYLCVIELPLELHGAQVRIEESGLIRATGGMELYGCTVDIGEYGQFMANACGAYLAPDTVITNYGGVDVSGWDDAEFACQLTNYGSLGLNDMVVISGTVVNHGHLGVWAGADSRIRVSGLLENHGEVEFYTDSFNRGGKFQPWAAGTVTGVPEQYVAD